MELIHAGAAQEYWVKKGEFLIQESLNIDWIAIHNAPASSPLFK
jgi:hypothetical protein